MSFSDAIGQVDQIVQWEQQLANPAAVTQSASTGGTVTTVDTSSSGAPSSASFADALAQAQSPNSNALSLLGATGTGAGTGGAMSASSLLSGGDSQLLSTLVSAGMTGASAGASAGTGMSATGAAGGSATSASDPRIEAMINEANSLIGKPYVWGGGHNDFGPQAGYDCSGFVSAVLHAGGYLSSPEDTTTMPGGAGIESGPGQYVTIYDRDAPGQEGHVIIEIDGQFYESGGEQGSWGGGGGVEKIATPSAAYLSTFNQILHPAGL